MTVLADFSGMWSDMFNPSHLPEVVLRTLVVYFGLLLAMRIAGKREVGQMKPFDLVTLLIISNALQNAMVGQDSSLVGGLTAAGIILLSNFVVGFLRGHSLMAQRLFEGSPTLIVHDCRFIDREMRRENLSEADVLQAMREHGFENVDQVKTAVLEVDGSISIIPKEQAHVTKTRRRVRRQPHP
jgi:uncharacterized membrane protein YcaP (DUF421 family)